MEQLLDNHFNQNVRQVVPTVYAIDLVQFGIKHKIAEAIRLGEKVLADQNERMPRDLAMAVKNFMLDERNSKNYRLAMKTTGPFNNSALYHKQKGEESSFYVVDDTYW